MRKWSVGLIHRQYLEQLLKQFSSQISSLESPFEASIRICIQTMNATRRLCKEIILNIQFRCPACHGSQYRTSPYDVTEKNHMGAKCIFCKTAMIAGDDLSHLVITSAPKLAEYHR